MKNLTEGTFPKSSEHDTGLPPVHQIRERHPGASALRRSLAMRIDGTGIEPGTVNDPVQQAKLQGQRQALRELVALIGRSVALTELTEAAQRPDLVPPPQLNAERQQFQMADLLVQQSMSQSNSAPLMQALQLYQQVFTDLAIPLHQNQASALEIHQDDDRMVIEWHHGGVLQWAQSPDGPWTDIADAVSPYRAPVDFQRQFFRVFKRQ